MVKLVKELYGVLEPYNNMLEIDVSPYNIGKEFKQMYNLFDTNKGGIIELTSGKTVPLNGKEISILKTLSLLSNEVPSYYADICLHYCYVYLAKFIGMQAEVSNKIPKVIRERLDNIIKEVIEK